MSVSEIRPTEKQLYERINELSLALRPFAELDIKSDLHGWDDKSQVGICVEGRTLDADMTVGDIRRARVTLES